VTAHTVRGVLLNPDGAPEPKIKITLDQEFTLTTETKDDGTFEFPAVRDGEWQLSAKLEGEGAVPRAAEWIEISGHDIEGIKLRLNEPFNVSGKVVFEVPQGTPTPKASQDHFGDFVR